MKLFLGAAPTCHLEHEDNSRRAKQNTSELLRKRLQNPVWKMLKPWWDPCKSQSFSSGLLRGPWASFTRFVALFVCHSSVVERSSELSRMIEELHQMTFSAPFFDHQAPESLLQGTTPLNSWTSALGRPSHKARSGQQCRWCMVSAAGTSCKLFSETE